MPISKERMQRVLDASQIIEQEALQIVEQEALAGQSPAEVVARLAAKPELREALELLARERQHFARQGLRLEKAKERARRKRGRASITSS